MPEIACSPYKISIIITCVIFLNFIIAEVSSSYSSVKENIDGLVLKEKASLIKDIISISPKVVKIDFPSEVNFFN